MRTRALVAFVLLLLPALGEAQLRVPRIGRRPGPTRGEPNPPMPPSIARELSYKRLNYSVESYPMVAHFDTWGYLSPGAPYDWTSGGAGTRVDYRVSHNFSATLDMTSSFIGGPMISNTVEIGTRARAPYGERRLYPFVDLRLGYVLALESDVRPYDVVDPFSPSQPVGRSGRYSQGLGGIAGTGVEYMLTRSISLVTSASVIQARMRQHSFRGTQVGPSSYLMNSYRYMVGLRFNPVRTIPRILGQQATSGGAQGH